MPSVSIDTFFACSLLVSVAIISTAFLAGTMQTQINSMQDLNKQDYLRTIADHIASGYGAPENWGSAGGVPVSLGLSAANSQGLFELDADKVSRLNSQNAYALSYPAAFQAARLSNIAIGVSVSQMLQIGVDLSGNSTLGNVTTYTFRVSVSQDLGPVNAALRCYIVANNFLSDVSNVTSSSGVGYVTVDLPISSSGPALLVVFARATFDDRVTACEVYPFAHLSEAPQPNLSFLALSPLNYTLNVNANYPSVNAEKAYALSFTYQSNLTSTSSTTYAIPALLDKSPIVLLVQGVNDTARFNEWTVYPQVPLDFGADFSHSEANVFVYPVTIKGALYKLTLRFGDVVK